MTKEEFTAWRESPATKWAMKALQTGAELERESWMKESWEEGACSMERLRNRRNRADIWKQIVGASYEDFCAFNGEVPVDE